MARTTALLCVAGIVPALSFTCPGNAQWVRFNDETATRMPTGAGLNDPATSTADPEEKDYAWGDVDKDGDIDLVCVRKQPFTTPGRRTNVLFLNEGVAQGHAINGVLVDRTAQYCTASDVPGDLGFLTPTNDRDVFLADVNNDTWLDIITATTLSDGAGKIIGHPRIYINLGNDPQGHWRGFRFEEARIPNMASPSAPSAQPRFCSVAAGDVTGDGYVDLYFGDYDSGGVEAYDYNNKLLINRGPAQPGYFDDSGTTRMSANPGLLSAFGAASIIADINNDGVNDVVKQTSLNAPLHVAIQHNNPNNVGFFPDSFYKVVNQDAPYFVSAGDLNNDGRLDLVISSDGADRYLLNQGNAADGTAAFTSFTFSYQLAGDDGFASNSVIVDLNNDGWNDVLIADVDVDISGCSRRTHIFRNLGNGMPGGGGNVTLQEQSPAVIPTTMLTGTHDIAPFDINNDGWTDLVIGRCSGTQVWINQPPAGLAFTYPTGLPAYVTPNQPHTFTIKATPIGTGGTVAAVKIFIATPGGSFVEHPTTSLGDNLYSATLPAIDCPQRVRFYISGQLSSGVTLTDPPGAPGSGGSGGYYVAVGSFGTLLSFEDEVESDVSGWLVVNDPSLTGGAWQAAVPNGTINAGVLAAPNEDATGGNEATHAFVTENGPSGSTNPSNWDVDGGPTHLISPAFNLAGTDATISFAAWFYTSVPGDVMNVSASNDDGASWVSVMDITTTSDPTSAGGTVWQTRSFVVGDYVTPSATVRVRFSVADVGTPSIVEAGIDNVRVDEFVCSLPSPCPADINGDHAVNVSDLLMIINAWSAPGGPADITGDGAVNVSDLLACINAWGPCPR